MLDVRKETEIGYQRNSQNEELATVKVWEETEILLSVSRSDDNDCSRLLCCRCPFSLEASSVPRVKNGPS